MSRFSRVLNELLTEKGLSQTELSALSGVDQSRLSRLLSAEHHPNRNDLSGLSVGFSEPKDRYRLFQSYLGDTIPSDVLACFNIELRDSVVREKYSARAWDLLPKEMLEALDFLVAEYPDNASICDVVVGWARALGWQREPTPPLQKDTAHKVIAAVKKISRYPRATRPKSQP